MKRILSVAALALLAVVLVLPAFAQDKESPLAVGKNVSATFHPYNVTARLIIKEEAEATDKDKDKTKKPDYTTRGKFHCLITEYDLEPVVMMFVSGVEDNEGIRSLLQKLDTAIERNPAVRLRGFVVFVEDSKDFNVIEDDEKREELEKKIQNIANDLKLKYVVLTLAGKSDVAKYDLDPAATLTAVLYKNLKIEAVHKASRDKLDKADADSVKSIMADVAGKLKATR